MSAPIRAANGQANEELADSPRAVGHSEEANVVEHDQANGEPTAVALGFSIGAERTEEIIGARDSEGGEESDGDEQFEDEEDEDEEDEDDDEDDEEPALKYERLGGALGDLLKKDSASALAVSNKLLVSNLPLPEEIVSFTI
jgi:hypothetical protein